ncbi:MAG TPA: ATP-binding protein [Bacteroidales bacterium]|jgi:nitrogen fixation/metabolism regulation signal transduction histidine kinase|nr:GHKL domain-containing protein [Bacteroidales bacterium]HKM12405.1 ATP-binding protein [Bacteroidales bacterium]HPB89167.1 ATP-binding protein [Bacteroidales bacterium]HPY21840.1 ATP-binding protein [Bacteroidales bacterium]HQP79126.1 ATP-binding protein [Bacteroidales bacterium]
MYLIISLFAIAVVVYRIIKLYNVAPEKIAYFFNAVENEDSTLHFPENTLHKANDEMNKSLNRINKLIQEAKFRNREQEQYYSLMLEQVATGIVVINEKGNVLQANSAAKNLLNYPTFYHIEQLKRIDANLFNTFHHLINGETHQFLKLTYKNNITQLSLRATSFPSHGENLRIISVHDISHELDAKEFDSWMKLIRVLTHEIMNSITPITSLSETLLRYYAFSDDSPANVNEKTISNTIKGLELINERGNGLIRFVESYRKLTKLSKPILQTISLKTFIDHLLMLLSHEENFSRINFSINIHPEDLSVEADEAQLSQVFINLIKNAMQAVEKVQEPQIEISARAKEDGHTQISVQDNGEGIPADIIEQIYIPFFTTKENGSGIGLSLSRQIMKNHGGTIDAHSVPGKTVFVLNL